MNQLEKKPKVSVDMCMSPAVVIALSVISEDSHIGHKLRILSETDGHWIRDIYVPLAMFRPLRRVGLLIKRHHAIYEGPTLLMFRDRELDPVVLELRMCLGDDLMGPMYCVCPCRVCKKKMRLCEEQEPTQEIKVVGIDSSLTTAIVNDLKRKRKYK